MGSAETAAASERSPAGAVGLTPWQRLRNIFGGSAGNLVEWFDWFAYASFSVYFASVFFPEGDQTTQFLKTAVIFTVGFIARPIGAWLMGIYADKAGRRAALTLSVSMMCAGSLVIALTPGHAVIGNFAAVVLVLARVLQGLSVGGEYGASATYVSEMAGRNNRGFWSGFLYVTLIAGQLLALLLLWLLQKILTEQQLHDWGWRIPFFIGAGLAIVVFWIRRGIHETTSFHNAGVSVNERGRTMMLFTRYPTETAMIVVLTAGGGLGFYAYTTYMQKFLINSAAGPMGEGFAKEQASQIMTTCLVIFMICQPLVGAMSDRIGRKITLMASYGLGALAAYPIFTAIEGSTTVLQATMLCFIPLVILSGYTSMSAIVKAELFPAHVRALGVAMPYAVAQAIFGGNAETLALKLKDAGHESAFFVIVAVVLAAGFATAILMRDTKKHSLIKED
ncbi:MAG TPA: MFS transporter [Steroidobacteraceae bacterium]